MPLEERAYSPLLSKKDEIYSYAKRELKDSQIKDITDELQRNIKADKSLRYKIDLSENHLSDNGVGKLVDWLSNSKWGNLCVELKLHKNHIGDAGAAILGQFLLNSKNKLEGLHLSHNKIGINGVMKILYGLADSKIGNRFTYPRIDEFGDNLVPLWLRLERNETPSLEEKLIEFRKYVITTRDYNESYQPICFITKRCRPHRCERGKKVLPPLCHLNITSTSSKILFNKLPMAHSHHTQIIEDGKTDSFSSQDVSDNEKSPILNSNSQDFKNSYKQINQNNEIPGGENLPFYILIDVSTLLDMLDLKKNDNICPFSLPGLLAMCNTGLMKYLDGELPQTKLLKTEDSERIVIIFVKNIFNELHQICYKNKDLLKKFEDSRDNFISPLMKNTVIELLEGCDEINHNVLDTISLKKAHDLSLSEETISTIQFALVWARNLSKVAEITNFHIQRPLNCIFITSNSSVFSFFKYLNVEKSDDLSNHLHCLTTNQINQLLINHFPSLKNSISHTSHSNLYNSNSSSTIFDNSSHLLKASTLIPILGKFINNTPSHYNSLISSLCPQKISSTQNSDQSFLPSISLSKSTIASSDQISDLNKNGVLITVTSSSANLSTELKTSCTTPIILSTSEINTLNSPSLPSNISSLSQSPFLQYQYNQFQATNNLFDSSTPLFNQASQTHIFSPLNYLPYSSTVSQTPFTLETISSSNKNFNTLEFPLNITNKLSEHQDLQHLLNSTFLQNSSESSSSSHSYPSYPLNHNNSLNSSGELNITSANISQNDISTLIYSPSLNNSLPQFLNYSNNCHQKDLNSSYPQQQPVNFSSNHPQHSLSNVTQIDELLALQNRNNNNALRSELIGAIAIVEELSNRLKIMGSHMPVYADDCLHRAKAHIKRWSNLLSIHNSSNYTKNEVNYNP